MKVQIVDENDNELHVSEEEDFNPDLHIRRSASLWLLNEKNEVLLAKRSKNKFRYPNVWSASAAGIIEEGETYEDNIIKEAFEEVRVKLDKVILGPKKLEFDDHKFFNQYFFAKIPSDTKFVLQETEVDEVKWITLAELKNWYNKKPEEFLVNFRDPLEVIENYLNKKDENQN